MRELVFLLEEPSAEAMLRSLLPRFIHESINCRYIAFEGKQDLEKQMVRRIRGYQNASARFVVLRDLDAEPDCATLKARLVALCAQSGKGSQCNVRLACCELETFYLADLMAVDRALETKALVKKQLSKRFRAPDQLQKPSTELITLTGRRYQKISGSREIGKHLDLNNERSPSFKNLISLLRRLEGSLLALNC